MGYPGVFARSRPEHPAVVMATSGRAVTYAELDRRSNRLAHLLRRRGLHRGDHIAIMAENHERWFDALWAASRAGLYFTPVNSHLTAEEAGYIVDDCDAQVLVTSSALASVAETAVALAPACRTVLVFRSDDDRTTSLPAGFEWLDDATAAMPDTPVDDESQGAGMFYSSGTTGRPKGILKPLPDLAVDEPNAVSATMRSQWGIGPDTVYLSPAPLYHTSPAQCCLGVQRFGGTAVVMESWDPEGALAAIEHHRIDTAQFVPTMFVRMLKLPDHVRSRHDVSSLRYVLHTAAPCSVEVKKRMLDWWGPVIRETYASSENPGYTWIEPEEWLAHPGSVGQAKWGVLRILDEHGNECARGVPGVIHFENPDVSWEYHKDPGKSADARSAEGWWTVGDMGYVDEQGYLFLTDRKSHMIISGGVNIYPAEIENVLVTHPRVLDAAVIGVPDDDRGEQVKAIVQLLDGVEQWPALEDDIIAFCRERLAHFKCPRSVDVVEQLPRLPTGKLYKQKLKDHYWAGRSSRIN
jgi:long-chain acyl-CoA synthetase